MWSLHIRMKNDYTHEQEVLECWKALVDRMDWTHWLNFNPCIPRLDEYAVQAIGQSISARLRDRLKLTKGSIVLVPEVSHDGLWHYHGFAAVPTAAKARQMDANGQRWALKKMRTLIQHRYSRHDDSSIRPSAVIEARKGDPADAQTYALKNGFLQGKAGTVIWS